MFFKFVNTVGLIKNIFLLLLQLRKVNCGIVLYYIILYDIDNIMTILYNYMIFIS